MKTCTQISDSGFRGKINGLTTFIRVTRLSEPALLPGLAFPM